MRHRVRPELVLRQAGNLIDYLVDMGLARAENAPILRTTPQGVEVTFSTAHLVTVSMKNRDYQDTHQLLLADKVFNFKMVDDALIQMMYRFDKQGVVKHRLAFFPSPVLDGFAVHPEAYLRERRWLDIARRSTVPTPLRFDYDLDAAQLDSGHPASHLTIGQYQSCRIPVSAPLMPRMFADFFLRHFYSAIIADNLPPSSVQFPASISKDEEKMIHLVVPE